MLTRVFPALLVLCALHAKHPIAHEDVWLMKRVGAPAASPDGKWVVFSVTQPAYDEKDQSSDLWLVPADGSAPARQLTFAKGAESGAAWSPDSKRVAFTTRRDGDEASQVYVLNVTEGGEAMRLTNVNSGASGPKWSPDGQRILFQTALHAGAETLDAHKKIATERKARKYNARVYDGFPIRYWDHWLDDRKPTVFVQTVDPAAAPHNLLAGAPLTKEAGFGGVNGLSSEDLQPVWTPDSKGVVFCATTDRHKSAYAHTTTRLYWAKLEGGPIVTWALGANTGYSKPQFRPDGKGLYALTSDESKPYSLSRLGHWMWPQAGNIRATFNDFDRSIDDYAFTPDSASVFAIAEEHGDTKLWRAPADGGKFAVYSGSAGTFSNLTMAGATPIATWDSAVSPAELVRVDGGAKRNLTNFNAQRAQEIDWLPVEHFWFTSKRGRKIHNLLVKPPAFDASKKYPLFVLIHGGPHGMWKDQFFLRWNYHLLAAPGYVLLLTDYTGSTGYGEEFAQAIQGDPLATPADEINQAADEAIAKYSFVDATRQAAGGASYGGHLANWLQATTTRYKCLISHAGLINLESQWGTSDTIYHRETNNGGPVWEQGAVWREQNPIRKAKNFKTPIMLTVGENDFRVPLNQTLENWSVLQRLQIPSRLIVFPDANHWIQKGEDSRFFYQEVHAWLRRWI